MNIKSFNNFLNEADLNNFLFNPKTPYEYDQTKWNREYFNLEGVSFDSIYKSIYLKLENDKQFEDINDYVGYAIIGLDSIINFVDKEYLKSKAHYKENAHYIYKNFSTRTNYIQIKIGRTYDIKDFDITKLSTKAKKAMKSLKLEFHGINFATKDVILTTEKGRADKTLKMDKNQKYEKFLKDLESKYDVKLSKPYGTDSTKLTVNFDGTDIDIEIKQI